MQYVCPFYLLQNTCSWSFYMLKNQNNSADFNSNLFFSECTKTLCTPGGGEVELDLFKDFKRSLTWDINVPDRTVLTLDFPAGFALQPGSVKCSDGRQYSVSTTKSNGTIQTKHYCKSGTASHLDLLGATTVNMQVPKEEEVEATAFTAKAAPRGKRAKQEPANLDPSTEETLAIVSTYCICTVYTVYLSFHQSLSVYLHKICEERHPEIVFIYLFNQEKSTYVFYKCVLAKTGSSTINIYR